MAQDIRAAKTLVKIAEYPNGYLRPITDEQDITLALARCAVASGSAAARHQVIRLYESVRSYHPTYAEKLRLIAAEGPSQHAHKRLIRS